MLVAVGLPGDSGASRTGSTALEASNFAGNGNERNGNDNYSLTEHDIEALSAITNSPVAYVRQAGFEKFVSEADILRSGTVGLFQEDSEAR